MVLGFGDFFIMSSVKLFFTLSRNRVLFRYLVMIMAAFFPRADEDHASAPAAKAAQPAIIPIATP